MRSRGALTAAVAVALIFHALFAVLAWRVKVPLYPIHDTPLRVELLPTLQARDRPEIPMPEPELKPGPVPRPYLRSPTPDLSPQTLFPDPLPHQDPAVARALASPVSPASLDPSQADRAAGEIPLLPRETPPPFLE